MRNFNQPLGGPFEVPQARADRVVSAANHLAGINMIARQSFGPSPADRPAEYYDAIANAPGFELTYDDPDGSCDTSAVTGLTLEMLDQQRARELEQEYEENFYHALHNWKNNR